MPHKTYSPTELEVLTSQIPKTPKPRPRWGRNGIYVWVETPLNWVSINETSGLYPSETLYPSDTLYPSKPIKYIEFDTTKGPVVRDGIYIRIGA